MNFERLQQHEQICRYLLTQFSRINSPEVIQDRIWGAWRVGRDTMALSCCRASLALLNARAPGQLLAWWRSNPRR